MESKELAKYLDYTNLSINATRNQIKKMVKDAVKYGFGGLCIAPCWVNFVQQKLENIEHNIEVMTVPNWAMGGGLDELVEGDMCFNTCSEIDYIWNTYSFSELKDWDKTKEELKEIREITKGKLKIIIEAYYLRVADEKIYKQGMKTVLKNACKLVNESDADWIKTDSGLFKRPEFETLLEDCKLMVKYSKKPVKAAGGITNRYQVETLIDAGIKRIGTSKAVEIVTSNI